MHNGPGSHDRVDKPGIVELTVGLEFHWDDHRKWADLFEQTHKFIYKGFEHEIKYSDWTTRDGWTVFESIDTMTNGRTPSFLVLLDGDNVITAIIESSTNVPDPNFKLVNDLEKAKK